MSFLATDGKTTCIPAVDADGKLWSMCKAPAVSTKLNWSPQHVEGKLFWREIVQ